MMDEMVDGKRWFVVKNTCMGFRQAWVDLTVKPEFWNSFEFVLPLDKFMDMHFCVDDPKNKRNKICTLMLGH